jgi:hypothetical protein
MGRNPVTIAALALCLGGCAEGTRIASVGALGGGHSLVTLVVTDDEDVVARECRSVPANGRILGCQMSWPVRPPNAPAARAVKIVRYADSLPSALTFEIDVQELCRAVASLQMREEACDTGSGGMALPAEVKTP